MPKFVFVYHGGTMPETPEEGERQMQLWGAWMQGLGSDLVDGGNPVGQSRTVFADRVANDGGANPASGYTLVNASDMDDAIAKARGCPILQNGGSVEVAEAIEM